MKYTVVWKPEAERQLAEIWVDTVYREAVTAAANQVEEILRARPGDAGESRGGCRRILVVEPLVVQFDVFDEDRSVRVLRIRMTPRQ
jgi:plasmid stabilization system protein ParE